MIMKRLRLLAVENERALQTVRLFINNPARAEAVS